MPSIPSRTAGCYHVTFRLDISESLKEGSRGQGFVACSNTLKNCYCQPLAAERAVAPGIRRPTPDGETRRLALPRISVATRWRQ